MTFGGAVTVNTGGATDAELDNVRFDSTLTVAADSGLAVTLTDVVFATGQTLETQNANTVVRLGSTLLAEGGLTIKGEGFIDGTANAYNISAGGALTLGASDESANISNASITGTGTLAIAQATSQDSERVTLENVQVDLTFERVTYTAIVLDGVTLNADVTLDTDAVDLGAFTLRGDVDANLNSIAGAVSIESGKASNVTFGGLLTVVTGSAVELNTVELDGGLTLNSNLVDITAVDVVIEQSQTLTVSKDANIIREDETDFKSSGTDVTVTFSSAEITFNGGTAITTGSLGSDGLID